MISHIVIAIHYFLLTLLTVSSICAGSKRFMDPSSYPGDFCVDDRAYGKKAGETAANKQSLILKRLADDYEQYDMMHESSDDEGAINAEEVFHRCMATCGNANISIDVKDRTGSMQEARTTTEDYLLDLFPGNNSIEIFSHAHISMLSIPDYNTHEEDIDAPFYNAKRLMDVDADMYSAVQALSRRNLTHVAGGRLEQYGRQFYDEDTYVPSKQFIGIPITEIDPLIIQLRERLFQATDGSRMNEHLHISLAAITLNSYEEYARLREFIASGRLATHEVRYPIQQMQLRRGPLIAKYNLD